MNISPLTPQAFTIIELLIVIVVIGILATIVLNTITGIQARANDTKVRTDLESFMKSLEGYNVDNGTFRVSGGGSGGNGNGWANWSNGTGYPDSVTNVLAANGYNSGVQSYDSTEVSGSSALTNHPNIYMLYRCIATEKIAVFGRLEAPTTEDNQTNTDWVNQGCTTTPCSTYTKCYAVESAGTYETW